MYKTSNLISHVGHLFLVFYLKNVQYTLTSIETIKNYLKFSKDMFICGDFVNNF